LCAELFEVFADELCVEQAEPFFDEALHEVAQGDFTGVGFAREHAFAKKNGAEGDAVETANQFVFVVAFDAVGVALFVQLMVQVHNRTIKPCIFAVGCLLRAVGNHFIELVVVSYAVGGGAHGAP